VFVRNEIRFDGKKWFKSVLEKMKQNFSSPRKLSIHVHTYVAVCTATYVLRC
jgi:hypothetical protein